jgi:hypothetical protein
MTIRQTTGIIPCSEMAQYSAGKADVKVFKAFAGSFPACPEKQADWG